MFHLLRARITRPYRSSVAVEEERVWIGFYRRVDNPAIAAEVIQHLDADAELKRTHPALYLCCKESLRKRKAHLARTKRIGRFMRSVLGRLLGRSESNVRPRPTPSGRIVVAGLAESRREPVQHAVQSRPPTDELAAVQPDGGQPDALRVSAPRLDRAASSNPKAA